MSYPERIVPDETEPGIVALHLKRYTFALPWCRGLEVLDLGCGVGYGTAHLADTARRVVGGDLDPDSIDYARRRYGGENVEFVELDATALPFEGSTFDTVCSFETIEHVDDPDLLVREAARVIRPTGTLLVSTPRADVTTRAPENPYHRVEYAREDFEGMLETCFADVQMYGERRLETVAHRVLRRLDILGLRRRSALVRRASALTGTPATEHLELDDIVISPDRIDRAEALYAICTLPRS